MTKGEAQRIANSALLLIVADGENRQRHWAFDAINHISDLPRETSHEQKLDRCREALHVLGVGTPSVSASAARATLRRIKSTVDEALRDYCERCRMAPCVCPAARRPEANR